MDVFAVELSKICNNLQIFESQNANQRFEDLRTVFSISLLLFYIEQTLSRSRFALFALAPSLTVGFDFANNTQLFAPLRMTHRGVHPFALPLIGVAFTLLKKQEPSYDDSRFQ